MAWSDSRYPRAQRLPADWQKRRARVLRRDGGVCQMCGHEGATEVDHIRRGDNHDLANLQAVHSECHKVKTARESGQASGAASRARAAAKYRPKEPHPGLRE